MGVWPTRVRSVSKPQEAVLRKLARHPVHEGNPLASEPQFFLGTSKRTLAFLVSCALIEQMWSGSGYLAREFSPYALTWRGKEYLNGLDRQRRRKR